MENNQQLNSFLLILSHSQRSPSTFMWVLAVGFEYPPALGVMRPVEGFDDSGIIWPICIGLNRVGLS